MFHVLPCASAGGGLQMATVDVLDCINRSGGALAPGDVVQFDFAQGDGDVSNYTWGDDNSAWKNVIAPTAAVVAGTSYAVIGVVQGSSSIADNGIVPRIRVVGPTDAYVIAASGSVALSNRLVATTAKNFDLVDAAGEPYLAWAMEAVATPTTRTLGQVWVNGFGGMGNGTG